ncbi:putative CRISPR-associated protein Csa1 [Sulfurisphaera tokodaii str. 7]|uniref:CRISPR-associated protein Csa1 n=1 Tax=Sulfurisphaera tokodaii (strain DSM 16993 / JCM 10545 / NBRC 100140 / 7) TaxID=273063 RepID=Q977B6_SULTO|nr:type I-A CRISPR-associated protein Cas4/Csa1 [Sulfurisphaera tokodaii]BAB64978.1 putative CRISPR-associated protein Csa1 [Sulfurisphaera tokodaii str. 7]
MFFTLSEIQLLSKRMKGFPRAISEELRGWHWNEPPLYPSSNTLLSVSDLTNGLCDSGRYVYLKHKGIVPKVEAKIGNTIHTTYATAIETIKRLIYEHEDLDSVKLRTLMTDEFYNLKVEVIEVAKILWDHIVSIYSAELEKARSKPFLRKDSLASLVIPFHVEYPVDGSLVGLQSALRVDAFIPILPLIAEMKTGSYKRDHELALAGYALAFESQYEIPVDFGYLCYVNVIEGKIHNNCRLIVISDTLRQEFVEVRDRALRAIDDDVDPGLAKKCSADCPFLPHCKGG